MAVTHPFVVLPGDADEGGFVAIFPDLPGCMTQGETLAEVAAMVEDAYALWIAAQEDAGATIPAAYSAGADVWARYRAVGKG